MATADMHPPVEPGARLGPYEIVDRLGAGGMGEVWRARDSRLDRSVAIKILPSAFAENTQLRLRFEREARTISKLTHPNICTLYDVGDDYLVMELLEGESLAQRLARGPLPLDEVLRYGAQIADALDRAHRAGVVHRDVKPANVVITKTGAKLLDFGLARASGSIVLDADAATVQRDAITEAGTIVGTFQYMAPEQLEGADADARTDIFALGAVLYEMTTGIRAFEGKSKASVIAAIMAANPPPLAQLQPMTPPALERLIRKCLRKDPDGRWQSAADVADELRWLSEGSASTAGIASARSARPRLWLAWGIAAAAILALLAGALFRVRERSAENENVRAVRFTIPLSGTERRLFTFGLLAVSPDGRSIVYSASVDGGSRLFLRPLDQMDAVPLEGTDQGLRPFFSPDGKWIGFFSVRRLMKVPADGGTPIHLCDAGSQPQGASWADDGSIVFAPFHKGVGIWRITGPGAEPQILTKIDEAKGERTHSSPHVLPGSEAFLFTILSNRGSHVVAQRFDGGKRTVLAQGREPRYLDGRLIFWRGGSLYAMAFDPKALATRGEPFPVMDRVSLEFAISASGDLLAFIPPGGTAAAGGLLKILDRSGRPLATPPGLQDENVWHQSWSPDEKAVTGVVPGKGVCIFDQNRGTWISFGRGIMPVWSPDGKRVTYGFPGTSSSPRSRSADGGGDDKPVLTRPVAEPTYWPMRWSPDAKHILLLSLHVRTGYDCYIADAVTGEVRPVAETEADEASAVFSPDGKWIAFAADHTGTTEIYVRPVDGEGRWQISTGGGDWPAWKSPGEIVYQSGRKIVAVAVSTTPAFSFGAPKVLFEGPYDSFDVSAEGERFLVVERRDTDAGPEQLAVVMHWNVELDRKLREGS